MSMREKIMEGVGNKDEPLWDKFLRVVVMLVVLLFETMAGIWILFMVGSFLYLLFKLTTKLIGLVFG